MTTTDGFEWPIGDPLFEVSLDAIAEGIDGNGVVSSGDLQVTATANTNEIQVAAGTLWHAGSEYSLGAAETHVLTDGDATYDRWDSVVFDTGTGSSTVLKGNAEADPEPPSPGAGQVLLAYIYVASGETDATDSEVKNFRAFSTDAADLRLNDSAGDYSSPHVEGALTEVIREAGDPLNGPLDLSGFGGSAPFKLGTNPGAFGAIVDAAIDGNSAQGTTHSFDFAVDGTTLLKVVAESDGAGGTQNAKVVINQDVDLPSGSVDTAQLVDAAITAAKIAENEVTTTELDDTIDLETMRARDNEITNEINTPPSYNEFPFLRMPLDGSATQGDRLSIAWYIGDTRLLQFYTESDGAGGIQNEVLNANVPINIKGGSLSSFPTGVFQGSLAYDSDRDTPVYLGSGGAYQRPESRPNADRLEQGESGSVAAGNSGIVTRTNLASGDALNVYRAGLTTSDGQAVPSGLDLIVILEDNSGGATKQTTILSGDGSTVFDKEAGDPLASYENTSGSGQTVAVVVDNGDFGSGTSSSQDIMADVLAEAE
jgi:hypothetical protein